MEVQLSETQANLIKKIAEKEGLADYEIETTSGSSKGDNYLGIITAVSVKKHTKKLNLILKAASDNENLRNLAPIRTVFLREIYIYDTVFSEFEKFEREEGVTQSFAGHPKMYASCDKNLSEFLILENLKGLGYQLWNRKVPMNADHIGLVFKEYGQLHGTSFAMKEKRPELYEKLSQNVKHIFEGSSKPEQYSKIVTNTLEDGFKAVEGDQFATEALKRHSLVAVKFLTEDVLKVDETSVILHGDCWCNNILFKYDDPQSKKPSKVSLIDWQMSFIGSPVLDLVYFLFSCAPKEILYDYKKYLKMYHNSLCETLRRFNCNPDTLFPFDVLEDEWQKYARYGVQAALIIMKFMLSDGDEAPDIAEAANSGKSFVDAMQFNTDHNDYNRRILDAITVSGENNWI